MTMTSQAGPISASEWEINVRKRLQKNRKDCRFSDNLGL
jgi:hypothetical protein